MTRVVHVLGARKLEGDIANPTFIFTNKLGGYASLSATPLSRYQGVFFNKGGEVYKVIENIIPLNAGPVNVVNNHFSWIQREHSVLKEEFIFPFNHNTFIYELNEEKEILLVLDCRKAYDDHQFGRYYTIAKESGKLVIKYTKKTDDKEDLSHGKTEYTFYLVVDESRNFQIIDQFLPAHYPYDKERNSSPWERYVYHAVKIKAKQLVLSFSTNKEEAIKENTKVINNFATIIQKQKARENNGYRTIKDLLVNMAYQAARNSLDQLTCTIDNRQGIYAGLWWFFQFWSRDEAVSLKAWMLQGNYHLAKEVIMNDLRNIKPSGRVPNRWPPSELESADGIYWIIKRTRDLLDLLEQEGLSHKYFTAEDRLFLKNKIETAMVGLLKSHTRDGFDVCGKKETWMDTAWKDDYREGIRLEQQALRLALYKALRLLCKESDDTICYRLAAHHEDELRQKVRQHFFKDGYLWDGINDATIRPNIFIVYYVYPELLTPSEWVACFKKILPKLWNAWGGLSTIAKDHPLYCDTHTGSDNRSYHRGDSWYWLNNLAAICMTRVSRFTFRKEIRKILESSTNEILWSGAVGHHAEISSSKQQESKGCLMQAWSAAMYIELVEELF
ncbi:hypothetical protein HY488_00395 [Candidatus Woesearchaeota archaeon]|nr:hypothetical protein [Candidatus Woesearchaeota archaeon]